VGDAATGSTAPSNGEVLEPELLRRDAILEAARLAADRFLADGVSWRDELSDVTASIGRAAEVSRVFVSENFLDDHGLLHSRQIAEWNAGGIAPQQDDPQLQSYPYDAGGFGRWRDVLSRGETLSGQIRDFPDAERALFEPQGVVSIVAVPVFVGADWWGIVGFDECHRERSWSAAELAALRTAASTIGVALRLERMGQQRVRALELLERRVAALRQVAANLVVDQPLETTLRDVVRIVVEAGSGVAAALHIVDPASGALSMLAGHGLPEGYEDGLRASWALGVDSPAATALREQQVRLVRNAPAITLANPKAAPIHRFLPHVEWDTLLSLPLDSLGGAVGALHVYYLPDEEPEDEEVAFLSAVANQAAVAVENARLLGEGRQSAALRERQRLARDLHDSVSQALFSMTLHARTAQLAMARQHLPDDGPLGRAVGQLRELTQGALAEMRALIFELRPGALAEEGLEAAVTKQATALAAREGLAITVTGPGQRLDVSEETEEHLYRIVLEALHNTVKHAGASAVSVAVREELDGIRVTVQDDGRGFDPAAAYAGHLGLRTMRDRATAIGATLDIDSAAGTGTAVQVRLPVPPTAAPPTAAPPTSSVGA
jgi:signal transduction histidine kinase